MRCIGLIAIGFTLLAGTALAQEDTTSPSDDQTDQPLIQDEIQVSDTAPEQADENDDYWQQVTCRQRETTGSRIRSRKVCATNAQWRARQEEIRRGLSSGMAGQNCPGGSC